MNGAAASRACSSVPDVCVTSVPPDPGGRVASGASNVPGAADGESRVAALPAVALDLRVWVHMRVMQGSLAMACDSESAAILRRRCASLGSESGRAVPRRPRLAVVPTGPAPDDCVLMRRAAALAAVRLLIVRARACYQPSRWRRWRGCWNAGADGGRDFQQSSIESGASVRAVAAPGWLPGPVVKVLFGW